MLEIKQPNAEIKIIDFGLAKTFLPDATGSDWNNYDEFTEKVGTLCIVAPEVINGRFSGYKADVWWIGVTSYVFLSRKKLGIDKEINY